jgi:hypothetical protein
LAVIRRLRATVPPGLLVATGTSRRPGGDTRSEQRLGRERRAASEVTRTVPKITDGRGGMRRGKQADTGHDLFSAGTDRAGSRMLRLAGATWPSQHRHPVNHSSAAVGRVVRADLTASPAPLVVTGFAAIAELVDLIGAWLTHPAPRVLRVVLGSEPFSTQRLAFGSPSVEFTDEVTRYWLEQEGVSLRLSAKIVQAKQALDGGLVDVRHVPGSVRLHAKIYAADTAVTVGSSNFTDNGLRAQLEANTRFTADADPADHAAVWQIAENYWNDADPWNTEFHALLDQLLQVVTWQEALARACADLLEGQWAERYLSSVIGTSTLWPSQVAGIAEALWVVDNVGSVLVADATGSGKTRMGAHLTRAVRDRLWSTGRVRNDLTVLVSPPAVRRPWQDEAIACGLTITPVSHGMLSHADASGQRPEERAVATAQVLAVDEAHNFLTRNSNRTRAIRASAADHVLLFTATPINRGAGDLLSLIDLLGADNFDDHTLDVLDQLERPGGQHATLKPAQQELLRAEIQRFTVRRTKTMLNALVDADPEAYRHPQSERVCRYPEHQLRTYATGETATDTALAERIRELAADLRGVTYLGSVLGIPPALRRDYSDEQWLSLRLSAAHGLATHHVTSAMRSSRAALLEHVLGTARALEICNLDLRTKQQPTGDLAGKARAAATGPRPRIELECPLPGWLADDAAWADACLRDADLYDAIADAAQQLSQARERHKADTIAALTDEHRLVLAFDRHPITLAAIAPLIEAGDIPIIIATGASETGKTAVRKAFRRDGEGRGIALCSDAMSEGLNLQGASAVLHLDLPTTLRTAEQRVGRVDRMDSPHDRIQAWWPIDGPAFAVRADELLTARATESAALLGSNLPIPALRDDATLDVRAHAEELEERRGEEWDGIRDALAPARDLVTGPDALVPAPVYATYRHNRHRVVARISPLTSSTPWAFIAVSARLRGAPRWMLLEGAEPTVTVGLEPVADGLRRRLHEDPPSRAFDATCETWLDRFLTAAEHAEHQLLPRRMQRAIEQMARTTGGWSKAAMARDDYDTAERWTQLQRLAAPGPDDVRADAHDTAERWLALVRPLLDHSRQQRRSRYSRIRDIDRTLLEQPLDLTEVETAFRGIEAAEPFSHRISACILGVPE